MADGNGPVNSEPLPGIELFPSTPKRSRMSAYFQFTSAFGNCFLNSWMPFSVTWLFHR